MLQVVRIVVELKILIGGALPDISGDIQRAFGGLGLLPSHEDFAKGSFSTFQFKFKLY